MSLPVVRCPGCGGAARVPADALGQMVACPRCQVPFVAAEEEPPAPAPARPVGPPDRPRPKPAWSRTEPKPRPAAVVPIAPPRAESVEGPPPAEAPDPEHDPHTPVPGGLPFSVLVGFALMPFGIPLLWFVGPLLTGFEPSLSLAVPVSLAIAAAALCLGVVYTIDWTATTRIKGVLILVCLAYLSAAGLYFLKKDLMDRVQRFFSVPTVWVPVGFPPPPDGGALVKMPGAPEAVQEQPFAGVDWANAVRVTYHADGADGPQAYSYLAAASRLRRPPVKPDDTWFDTVGRRLKDETRAQAVKETPVARDNHPGRQWELRLPGGNAVRVVRVFVVQGRVYYLAVEGPNLNPDDETLVQPFFNSFAVPAQK